MKFLKIGGTKQGIIIPKQIAFKVLNWNLGDQLNWELTQDRKGITIKKKQVVMTLDDINNRG